MDVEELLTKKHIHYTEKGHDFIVHCLNPEHEDNNPSMRIDRITGIFGCFSCGFAGNVFAHFGEKGNYLQQKRQLLRNKINNKLAENVGLEIPDNAVPFEQDWRGINADTYKKFGAFQHSDPKFKGRVVFPIQSFGQKIVGFNGRSTSPDVTPRYMIVPEKAKFPLFPALITPIQSSIILVEGIFDMLNLHDKGLTNAVCAFGTQKVTKDKLNILKMQGVNRIDIFFDPDEAGELAHKTVADLVDSLEMESRQIKFGKSDPGALTAQQVLKLKETLYG